MSFAFDPEAKTPAEPKGAAIPPRIPKMKPKKQPEKLGLIPALFVFVFAVVALALTLASLFFVAGFGWHGAEHVWGLVSGL